MKKTVLAAAAAVLAAGCASTTRPPQHLGMAHYAPQATMNRCAAQLGGSPSSQVVLEKLARTAAQQRFAACTGAPVVCVRNVMLNSGDAAIGSSAGRRSVAVALRSCTAQAGTP